MVGTVVQLGVVTLVAGIGMAMVRIVRGPEVADRVLAADVLSLEVVGLVILLAVDQQRSLSLDAALLVAIVGFASTLAFAQFIGVTRSGSEPPDDRTGS
ncbi:MAG: monovalent cation/H+ antiporter complex subunit F [Actinomycetota bacterium]|nr:monovalent cation/H+ antiporter complex subunit F [Actinomycetota bacterium]MEC9427327.1 monovalent cation/H+ antiporter complex subunit F [Actinomycetota bacterium]MEC9450717.1 monovalent cation/H+ antiporter complex subunit F [Actinomycetota bacterium]MED5167129.1 monovalent cation/H+ antiporter complex subunit F [Actinomycetota bacterium]MED5397239.1 monovalent cation/H+ antiporter complex subunit F [Actinomycetota bacterium]